MSDYQVPSEWRDSFNQFSEDSLHLFAKLYLSNLKAHSRELIIEALWSYANRSEFCQNSLEALDSFDTEILLLLYLGVQDVKSLAQSLPKYSCIEICLKLLHLQERLLVLQLPPSPSKTEIHSSLLISKAEKTERSMPNVSGIHFTIAAQILGHLQQRLNLCSMFEGILLSKEQIRQWKSQFPLPPLKLSSELVLASALFFAQKNMNPKRKLSKTQIAKYQECFSAVELEQIPSLCQLIHDLGLVYFKDEQAQFSLAAFSSLWKAPYYERLLSLQALISGLSSKFFAKLLGIWPQHLVLSGPQLHSLLSLSGIPKEMTGTSIQTMLEWNILCVFPRELELSKADEPLYALNPQIYESIWGQTSGNTQSGHNRLSDNWELYCDLRHPEQYIELLLCARIEHFAALSLFHIEKQQFQSYFNAEADKFQNFIQQTQKIQHAGIHISELICEQWKEWFHDSTRFQLFQGCMLICQSSYNQLIVRLLSEEPEEAIILSNPQPGVFYLDPELQQQWHSKLINAGIYPSKPFANRDARETAHRSLKFSIQNVIEQARIHAEFLDNKTTTELKPQKDTWSDWPTDFVVFAESRKLVLHDRNFSRLHAHFREARGVDYTSKRNLLHSLLTARNHMAILTVAEGEDFDLVSYTVMPLCLEGPKENPSLLALDLQQEKILHFSVKSITRVNEVFYSLINVCLLSLLPLPYIYRLESEYNEAEQPK